MMLLILFIDTSNSVDIMFLECFERMNLEAKLLPVEPALYDFSGGSVQLLGQIVLPMAFGVAPTQKGGW